MSYYQQVNAPALRVVELFAGVGGFRLGLEQVNDDSRRAYEVVWSNQWEPSTRVQHASDIYSRRFGPDNHSNQDIAAVPASALPEHEVLVGGFPCQDYSVARTLNQSEGLRGKKGVLWWEIHRLLLELGAKRPKYLVLENVDRLLKSPAKQRGRDFAVMLSSLLDLGYLVEWRVLNAADYGMPQRRKRVFIIAYLDQSSIADGAKGSQALDWVAKNGVLGQAFPSSLSIGKNPLEFAIHGNLADVSEEFNSQANHTVFRNAGMARQVGSERIITTFDVTPEFSGESMTLGSVIIRDEDVPDEYFIENSELDKWRYLKGAKSIKRVNKQTQHEYSYQEGKMAFPDDLSKPARTIVTGEGGRTPSRFKHVIQTSSGRYRRLTPVELERLNMFPDDHTAGVSDARRAFFMGNALVVGVVTHIGRSLLAHHLNEVPSSVSPDSSPKQYGLFLG